MGAHGTESTNGKAADSADIPLENYAVMRYIYNADKIDAFQATLKLKIPDILAKAEAEGKPSLSAEEIVERLPARRTRAGPEIAKKLQTLLQPLLQDGMFTPSVVHGDTVYSNTDISRSFVENNSNNLLGIAGFRFSRPIRKAFECLEHALLDESKCPFEVGNGISFYEQLTNDSELESKFLASLKGNNKELPQLFERLQQSGVLQGAKKLVDVGGSTGTFLAQIIDRNPDIHGINFDLPHVISTPEAAKGVKHVGGSFFDSVPSGDVMILKFILHNHGDEDGIRILRQCYEALPQNGKVLIFEYVLPGVEEDNPDRDYNIAHCLDLGMVTFFGTGRERRMEEYKAMLTAAGFSSPNLISIPRCMDIITAFKS